MEKILRNIKTNHTKSNIENQNKKLVCFVNADDNMIINNWYSYTFIGLFGVWCFWCLFVFCFFSIFVYLFNSVHPINVINIMTWWIDRIKFTWSTSYTIMEFDLTEKWSSFGTLAIHLYSHGNCSFLAEFFYLFIFFLYVLVLVVNIALALFHSIFVRFVRHIHSQTYTVCCPQSFIIDFCRIQTLFNSNIYGYAFWTLSLNLSHLHLLLSAFLNICLYVYNTHNTFNMNIIYIACHER